MKPLTDVYIISTDKYLLAHWEKINLDDWETHVIDHISHISTEKSLVIVDVDVINWADEQWQAVFEKQHVMVASCYPSDSEGQMAIVAGARAYLHAYSSPSLIEQALTQISYGQIWIGESLLSRLLSQIGQKLSEQPRWQQELTAREITIAQRAALGHSNQLIANDLGISVRTVRAHLSAVFEKLNINDRLMLALIVHGIS